MENKEQVIDKTNNISKTYKEVFAEWLAILEQKDENGERVILTEEQKKGSEMFAEYLDSSNVLSNELTLLAVMRAREIDREVLLALVDVIGLEKAREVIQTIYDKHMHRKNESNDVPKIPEEA